MLVSAYSPRIEEVEEIKNGFLEEMECKFSYIFYANNKSCVRRNRERSVLVGLRRGSIIFLWLF